MKLRLFIVMGLVLALSLAIAGAASAQTLPPTPPPPPPGAPEPAVTGGSLSPVTETPDGDPLPGAPMGFRPATPAYLVGVPEGGGAEACVPVPEGFRQFFLMFLGGDGKWHIVPTTLADGQACATFTVTSIIQGFGF